MKRIFRSNSSNRRNSESTSRDGMSVQSNKSSDEERDMITSLREEPSYKSSVFSPHQTFDSYSTNPTTNASSSLQKNKQQLQETVEEGEEGEQSQPGGFLSNIDNVGKPLRVISADRYDLLTRSTTNLSIGGGGPGARKGSNEHGGGAGRKNSDSSGLLSGSFNSGGFEYKREVLTLQKVEEELTLLNENVLELMDRVNQNVVNTSKASISLVELLDETLSFNTFNGVGLKVETNENLRNILKVVLQFHDTFLRFEVYENSKNLLIRSLKEFLNRLGFNLDLNSFGTIPFIKNFSVFDDCQLPNKDKLELILERIINSNSSMISDQEGSFIAPLLRGLTKSSSILSIMFGFPDPQSDHYDILNALFQTFPDIHFFIVKNHIKPCSGSSKPYRFTPPFRIPTRNSPEISISISSESGLKSSGTLGGYITPKFTANTDRSLLKYKGAKFALTCAHVLLGEDQDYPIATVPSNVLMNAYKSTLSDERDRYPKDSQEYKSYDLELRNCDDEYSLKLGQVIWGERILIKNKISDVAIVKLDDSLKKIENTLGDDPTIPISLKFKNSFIKKVIPTSQFKSHSKVFKIGSKTKYTTGEINGIKMIYWLEGHLQTSEFVISAPEPMFANGGDSGSLVLNDLSNELGLGVIGMLHSYDGEMKQFGLFTPVQDILDRLRDVTGLEWAFI